MSVRARTLPRQQGIREPFLSRVIAFKY